jgi:tellurite resistance protein TerC
MTPNQWTYLVFGSILLLALLLDLGLLSKAQTTVSIKKAIGQTLLWIALAMAFAGFIWIKQGDKAAMQYVSAYLMEWSLSVDNIFVFILLFKFFQVAERYYARVLLIGILMAVVFRVLFLSGGLAIVSMAHWVLYIFGAFLLYTGISMFRAKGEASFDPGKNRVFRLLQKYLRISNEDPQGRYFVRQEGKNYLTRLSVVIILLATTDIVFALDSIPAVLAISSVPIIVYTSNIFAVLGLRSLFFLLKGAVSRFSYLQQGIAIVLIFIGVKMLVDIWSIRLPAWLSMTVIAGCLGGSVGYSLYKQKRGTGDSSNLI